VKCDGVLPCARCSKNSLLCIFSPGKKKHSILHLQSWIFFFLKLIVEE